MLTAVACARRPSSDSAYPVGAWHAARALSAADPRSFRQGVREAEHAFSWRMHRSNLSSSRARPGCAAQSAGCVSARACVHSDVRCSSPPSHCPRLPREACKREEQAAQQQTQATRGAWRRRDAELRADEGGALRGDNKRCAKRSWTTEPSENHFRTSSAVTPALRAGHAGCAMLPAAAGWTGETVVRLVASVRKCIAV
jgi:hypothetical protein